MKDYPKSLKEETVRTAREQLLKQKHILPLTLFVGKIRKEQGENAYIPYFDPLDGGIKAKCLFVLEAPGAKTKNSGFISRNNNDETAKNFIEINVLAGIPREKTIAWNIVPWYIGTNKKIRTAKNSDIKVGLLYLYQLIELLPKLQVIVLVGKKAQKVSRELTGKYNNIEIFECYHPSPMFVNRKPANKQVIINQLKKVSKALELVSNFV